MISRIIYEDKHLLVCCKPAGFATQTAQIGQMDMVSELRNFLASKKQEEMSANSRGRMQTPYLGVIHRLDQPVEGLLLFAKTKETAAALTRQLGAGILNKQYYAVTYGEPYADEDKLEDYLLTDKKKGISTIAGESITKDAITKDAKKAVLHFRVMESVKAPGVVPGGELHLLHIHIETGRLHQIRVQMAHAGMPLLGDRKYGEGKSADYSQNVALCAYQIEFPHPVTGKYLSFRIKPEGKAFTLFPELNKIDII